jgi:hypothetical protein
MHARAFRDPILPSSAQSVENAFDPDCVDFTAYLARRLGVQRELAFDVLAHWLQHFEPTEGDQAIVSESLGPELCKASHASGVFPVVAAVEGARTGTSG